MKERRAEPRLWCSDLIRVWVESSEGRELAGNLEDVAPSGACVQIEEPIDVGARVCLKFGRHTFHGEVMHCTHNEIGYFAGVRFDAGRKWSRELFEPKHLLDPRQVKPRRVKPRPANSRTNA